MYFKNAEVLGGDFKFKKADFAVSDGRFCETGDTAEAFDLTGKYVIPGLIDVHTHGAVGIDAMDENLDFAKLQSYLFSYGVTTFYPSTISEHQEPLEKALKQLADNPAVEGINLEGPYLCAKMRGAHNEDTIRPSTIEEFDKLYKISGGKIKITTIAPEIGNNTDIIKEITENYNVKVAVGHSAADYETAKKAFNSGATQLTHTFNAMSPIHHRNPGIIGAAHENENVFFEVISDGIHLHPAIVTMLFKIAGGDRTLLVSDSMSATGLSDGKYNLGGVNVTVKDTVARTDDGAIAGSTHNLMQMVRYAISFGIPKETAIKSASLIPAKALGIDDEQGSIETGKKADFSVCDKDLNVIAVFKNGKKVFGNL